MLHTPAQADEARFRVMPDVVQGPSLLAATINATLGNGARMVHSGFEPVIYRDWFLATEDHAHRVVARQQDISHWGTLRSGALDGAEVEILRLENGAFRSVRRGRITKGGFHASGWIRALPGRRVIPAGATTTTFSWERWNRPNAPYWFTLRAVDRQGRLSAPATAVMALSPPRIPGTPEEGPALVAFKPDLRTGGGPQPPQDLAAHLTGDGRLALTWHPGEGEVAGYVLYRSDLSPDRHRGFHLGLERDWGAEPVQAGDLVILRTTLMNARRQDMLTNRVWDANQATRLLKPSPVRFFRDEDLGRDWRLVPHAPDTPVSEPGATYLEMTLGRGVTERIGWATDSGTGQNWYPVLEPGRTYRVEAWMKANRAARVRVRFRGFHDQPAHRIRQIPFQVGLNWRKYEAKFTPLARDLGKTPNSIVLETTGPVELSIDNFRIYSADAPFLGLRPKDKARLMAAGTGVLRTHSLIKTKRKTYDLDQLTHPPGLASGTQRGTSLPQRLAMMEEVDADPWLQIEPHLTPEEWLGLVEYLAAPTGPGRRWAAKRATQGREAPWTQAFGKIYLELGNETWNRLFAPWIFRPMRDAITGRDYDAGAVYGLYQDYVMNILRQSPHWSRALEDQIVVVLGGWEINPGYGAAAARHAQSAEILTTAPYIGGWEAGDAVPEETPEDYARTLTHVLQASLPRARQHLEAVSEINVRRTDPIRLGTYESGPGYVMDGLNGRRVTPVQARVQERVMKSVAAGTATLDAFLARAMAGYRIESFFTYGPGPRWRSHAEWYRGGHTYPSWALLGLFNRVARGDFLRVETLSVPRTDLPEGHRRKALDDAPMIAAYATRAGDRLTIVLISRQIPGVTAPAALGATEVTVDLPRAGPMRHTLHGLTGAYHTHNATGPASTVFSRRLPNLPGGSQPRLVTQLRPGTTQVHVLEPIKF